MMCIPLLSLLIFFHFWPLKLSADDSSGFEALLSEPLQASKNSEVLAFQKNLIGQDAEKLILCRFIEDGKWRKAMYQWESAVTSDFRNSDNGRALYSYLLLKNELPLNALETLLSTQPDKIAPGIIRLWSKEAKSFKEAWLYISNPYNSNWAQQFDKGAEVRWRSHELVGPTNHTDVESLLSTTNAGTWENSWLTWQLVVNHSIFGKSGTASKNLGRLLKSKNQPISDDLMDMTAARLLYSAGLLEAAKFYYEKVSNQSDFWPESREELAWKALREGDTTDVANYIDPIFAPPFSFWITSEAWYLKALAELRLKDFKSLTKTHQEFTEFAKNKIKYLKLLGSSSETEATAQFLDRSLKGPVKMVEMGETAQKLPRYTTRDLVLDFQIQAYRRFSKEAAIAERIYQTSLSRGTFQVGFEGYIKELQLKTRARASRAKSAAFNRIQKLAKDELIEISSVSDKFLVVLAEMTQIQTK